MKAPSSLRWSSAVRSLAGLAVVAVVLNALAAAPPRTEALLVAAEEAASKFGVKKTKTVGFHDDNKSFTELPNPGGILVGFDLGVGKSGKAETVYAVRGIFKTARGEVVGPDHGLFADKKIDKRTVKTRVLRTVRVKARDGYAVGGLTLRTGFNINGLAVTFMKIEDGWLNPNQSYDSDYVGDRTGGSKQALSGDGAPVIGFFGSEDEDHIQSLGLYTMLESFRPKLIPEEEPKKEVPVEPKEPEVKAETPPAAPVEEEAAAWPSWLPLVIFVAVTIPAFAVLLLSFNRRSHLAPHAAPAPPRPTPPAGQVPIDVVPADPAAPKDAITASKPAWGPTMPYVPEYDPMHMGADDPDLARPGLSSSAGFANPHGFGDRFRKPEAVDSAAFVKVRKEVVITMLSIAALQFVCGMLLVAIAPTLAGAGQNAAAMKAVLPMLMAIMFGIALVFVGLGVWGWHQPFMASVVGLVVYGGIFLLDIMANKDVAMKGIFVKVAIICALVSCVSRSSKVNG